VRSTMMDFPLTIGRIFEHGRALYADSTVVTSEAEGVRRIEFWALAERAEQLAAGLRRLGVRPGDRVATFAWNNQEHQEAYFAVPGMGAVLHTLNIRLSVEQLRYIIGHAEDSVIILDASLAPVFAPVLAGGPDELKTVRHLIVFGDGDRSGLPGHIDYEELLAVERPGYPWPEVEETAAAAMCYTSGTTDRPKGVVYSHRSTFLHSLGVCSGEALGLSQYDRLLPVVPMFHGNAWGIPYAGWLVGADLLLPHRFTQADRLARFIAAERATIAMAVPTVWFDVLGLDPGSIDLSSLRMIMCGGAAVPRSLIEAYEQRLGVRIVQGWGLTETSPVASLAFPPKNAPAERAIDYRATAGRPLGGVEARVVDATGNVLPSDGHATGEIEVRGPWVAGGYYRDPASDKFPDGWLRTGDVGRIDAKGYITISDRFKDVVKSGGEWVSTLELEAALLTHPAVREAAVIATPDERWGERPLACIVCSPGQSVSPEELRAHLSDRVVKWWLPEQWAFVDEVPRTSVGKYDKRLLRARNTEGSLDVVVSGVAARQAAEPQPAGSRSTEPEPADESATRSSTV
jgi:fatty-acyl-CoA synthase